MGEFIGGVAVIVVIIFIAQWLMGLNYRDSKKDKPRNTTTKRQDYAYSVKPYMNTSELQIYAKLKNIVRGTTYIVYPQVPLASVLEKDAAGWVYRNELYRNIDFGIFDENYNCVILIEFFGPYHEQWKVKKKDAKVRALCNKAGLDVIQCWYTKDNDEWWLKQQIRDLSKEHIEF